MILSRAGLDAAVCVCVCVYGRVCPSLSVMAERHLLCLCFCVSVFSARSLLSVASFLDFLPAGHWPDSAWPQSPDAIVSVLK